MIGLIGAIAVAAGVMHVVRKYILRVKDPSLEEVWEELNQQNWYQDLIQDEQVSHFMDVQKQQGLLSDWYYVRKIIKQKGPRDGFIEFVKKELKTVD